MICNYVAVLDIFPVDLCWFNNDDDINVDNAAILFQALDVAAGFVVLC